MNHPNSCYIVIVQVNIQRFENDDPERIFDPVIRVLLLYEILFHPGGLVSNNITLR